MDTRAKESHPQNLQGLVLFIKDISHLTTDFDAYLDNAPHKDSNLDIIKTLARETAESAGLIQPIDRRQTLQIFLDEVASMYPKTIYDFWNQLKEKINDRFRLKNTDKDAPSTLAITQAICTELVKSLFNQFVEQKDLQKYVKCLYDALRMGGAEFRMDSYIDWNKIDSSTFISWLSQDPVSCFRAMNHMTHNGLQPSFPVINISLLSNLGVSIGDVFLANKLRPQWKSDYSGLLPFDIMKYIANFLSGVDLQRFRQVSKHCYNIVEEKGSLCSIKYHQFYTNANFRSQGLQINKQVIDRILYFDHDYLLANECNQYYVFSIKNNYSVTSFSIDSGNWPCGGYIHHNENEFNIFVVNPFRINVISGFHINHIKVGLLQELEGKEVDWPYVFLNLPAFDPTQLNIRECETRAQIEVNENYVTTHINFYKKEVSAENKTNRFSFFRSPPIKNIELNTLLTDFTDKGKEVTPSYII